MNMNEAIEKIEERKKAWEEFATKAYQWLYDTSYFEYPHYILKKLGYCEDYLLDDYYYDAQCAESIIYELNVVLELLKKALEEEKNRHD